MRIALFSYEFPPQTARGGIAASSYQTAQMMARRGHHVEVFAGSEERASSSIEDGVMVHRVLHPDQDHDRFHQVIAPVFAQRHATVGFDLFESPELLAEGLSTMKLTPRVARVVKVHSPNAFLLEATHGQYPPPGIRERVRLHFDALRQGQKPYWAGFGHATPQSAELREQFSREREVVEQADTLISPSNHLAARIVDEWHIDASIIHNVPNVFQPGGALLDIPAQTSTACIAFVGRLEPLKGVFDLARAIPLIRRRYPAVTFKLIGETQQSDLFGDMGHYLRRTLLRNEIDQTELVGPTPADQVASHLAAADICVFPSIFDNFPYVCLEAMAAARGVVGTHGTGMAEMIADRETGRLVLPQQPRAIADAVLDLLKNPQERMRMGAAAREHVLATYCPAALAPRQEKAYQQAMEQRDRRMAATVNEKVAQDA